jgi:hypothetical protein
MKLSSVAGTTHQLVGLALQNATNVQHFSLISVIATCLVNGMIVIVGKFYQINWIGVNFLLLQAVMGRGVSHGKPLIV